MGKQKRERRTTPEVETRKLVDLLVTQRKESQHPLFSRHWPLVWGFRTQRLPRRLLIWATPPRWINPLSVAVFTASRHGNHIGGAGGRRWYCPPCGRR